MDGELPDLAELGEIIRAYSAATAELQQSHELLQQQVMQLTGELQRKNAELSNTVTQVSSLKNYLAGIIQSSADGIVAIDLNRRVTAWNPAADVLFEICPPESGDAGGAFVLDAMQGQCREFATMMMRSMQEDREFYRVETRLTDGTGRNRIFSASSSPVVSGGDGEGQGRKNVGAVLIFHELTEVRELEERANRHDRLAALGEMAAGVAHEIRNPLGGIELYASSLRRKFGEDSGEYATCGKIIAAATSLNRIVTDMLTFTRSRPPQVRKSQVAQVVRGAVDMAARERERKKIDVTFSLPDDGLPCTLDPDQLVQACLNVVLNAIQAMPEGGRLDISSWRGENADGAPELCICFADDGTGIPDGVKDKIFNPFFTLRKDGTGLGLAIVHKIIQDHGGSIDVRDNRPRGALVTFRLPGA
jgi:signal transduction histidine kinase